MRDKFQTFGQRECARALADVATGRRRVSPEELLRLTSPRLDVPSPARVACANDPVSVGANLERVAAGGVRVEPRGVFLAGLRRWANGLRVLRRARRAPEPAASVLMGGRAAYVPKG
ncbi:MAG TPA: hypothetical protein VMI11_07525 [Actinomycetes bacterium]|nr:hypothetical protein [Actinomycetes bacterium]